MLAVICIWVLFRENNWTIRITMLKSHWLTTRAPIVNQQRKSHPQANFIITCNFTCHINPMYRYSSNIAGNFVKGFKLKSAHLQITS